MYNKMVLTVRETKKDGVGASESLRLSCARFQREAVPVR